MNLFQILSLSLCVLSLSLVVAGILRGRVGRLPGLAWILVWGLAGTAIARPQITVRAARWFGIDRGADLVFYLAILGTMIGFFLVVTRLRRLDEALTRLTRQIAVDEALRADGEREDEVRRDA